MKNKIAIYCIILIFISILGCKNEPDKYYEVLSSFFEENNANDIFLVIPIDVGCESCIKKSIDFIKNTPQTNYKVILAGANTKQNKIFLDKYELVENNLLKIDEKHILFKEELIFTNPIVYHFKDKALKKKVELVPNNINQELLNLK